MTPFDRDFALSTLLPLAEAAYTMQTQHPVLPAGMGMVAPIHIDTDSAIHKAATLLDHILVLQKENPTFGFTALAGATLYISIRGTTCLEEWMDDFYCPLVPVGDFAVHTGFQTVFEGVLPSLRYGVTAAGPLTAIHVIGHSLGAAVATLAAASLATTQNLPVHLTTFESPRAGDDAFSAHCRKVLASSFRVANSRDIVTHGPTRPLYSHTGDAIVFDGWKSTTAFNQRFDVHYQHSLETSCTPGLAALDRFPATVELS